MNTASLDFNALHDQFRPRVLRYVTRLVGEAEAEDVTQCVMLKVNEGLSGFRGDSIGSARRQLNVSPTRNMNSTKTTFRPPYKVHRPRQRPFAKRRVLA
jgi:hypothetical protein